MPLTTGSKLGSYEIVEPIGAGGMGEVYRARDTKLGRDVAIKTLPEELAGDGDRLARFDREARLLASLNHPKIATLHGLDEADGTRFLVMELVEGETLADRLKRGPLSVERALDIARQVADALEAAHEKGVIHRDLKPGNIMVLADDGGIKVLDFGLAKAFATQAGDESAELSQSPTLTRQASVAGVIVGTAAYMSPEQARGKAVDKRTDIFAFGSVLYEMLTGRKAFAGEDISDVLASVIKLEPDWNALPPDVPPRVRELLRRCLEKDPKSRRRDIGDVRLEIEQVLAAPKPEGEPASLPSRAPTQRRSPMTAMAFVLFGLLIGLATWFLKPSAPPADTMIFEHVLPEGHFFSVVSSQIIAVSPDGKRIVYAANDQLYMRSLDAAEAVPIRGTEGNPRNAIFSPDGQWIGFQAGGELRKVAAAGGAFVKLSDMGPPDGMSWAPDGTILFARRDSGIMIVPEDGGTPEVLVPAEDGARFHGPQMLSGGQRLLLTRGNSMSWEDAQLVVHSLETGEHKTVVARGSDGRYLPSGHLVYAVDNTVFAVRFDVDALAVTGVPAPVVESVRRAIGTGGTQFSVSDNGVLAYVPETRGLGNGHLVWIDRSGKVTRLTEKAAAYRSPRLSPDGARLAVLIENDVWIHEIDSDASSRFTTDGANRTPVWSPDGASVSFSSDGVIASRRSDFSTPAESTAIEGFTYAWTPDGEALLFGRNAPDTALDIWALTSDGEPQLLHGTPASELSPALSPDGKWMTFTSTESGRLEIYVQPFPGPGRRWTVSTNGGAHSAWSPSGQELFYMAGGQLVAVDVTTEPEFRVGPPRVLFEKVFQRGLGFRQYDVTPDGERFVAVEVENEDRGRQQVTVVLNWFQELERLAPSP